MRKGNINRAFMPLFIMAAVILGMYVNSIIARRTDGQQELFLPVRGSKLDYVINMIHHSYVDSVDIKKIEESAILQLIKDLDPHTVYIPAEDMVRTNEEMMGNFGGIGVQFYKYRDTVNVLQVISGGPSEKGGIKAGDLIIKVNDSLIAGVNMDDAKIMSLLRGELDTDVSLTLFRQGEKLPLIRKITRGNIPVKSVDVAYMVNDTTGFVKIHTFGMNTYDEFMAAMQQLERTGMRKLILDLRNNEGGILPIALKMVNEFLDANELILYTQGNASPRSDYYANGKGKYKALPLTVLINESSASASEIFAGAIQDNDRGAIVGRRSFGKGLVQEQRMLPDGSALRLTVARYYIPSGRSIQRPYDEGKEKYYTDYYERLYLGEMTEKDSVHFDENQKFQTVGGRTVYGGGGIMPDIFVPADTAGYSNYLLHLSRSKALYHFTIEFTNQHRKRLENMKSYGNVLRYLNQYDIVGEMAVYAEKNGVKRDNKGLQESYDFIKTQLEAYICRHVLDDAGYYPVLGRSDTTLWEAIKR